MLQTFEDQGYVVLPGFLQSEQIDELKEAVDRHAAARYERHAYTDEAIGALTWDARICEVVDQVMGGRYVFHHVHAARHDAGCEGVNWHQDYEQHPQTNRSHVMVHVFFYLNGLDGTVGDLLVLPGSEKSVLARDAFWFLGTPDLPGSLTVDDVPPGTAVIVHSAMLHARRAKPGGEGNPRYFIDSSYCQSGVLWPSAYNTPDALSELRERHVDAGGTRPWLFDKAQFFDSTRAHAVDSELKGSVILGLPQWQPS